MAAATAIAARKVNRPVRVVLDMRSNMEMFGKRLPYLGTYKVLTHVAPIFQTRTHGVYRKVLYFWILGAFSCW